MALLFERQGAFFDVGKEFEELVALVYKYNPFPWRVEQPQKQEDECCKKQKTTAQQMRSALGAAATASEGLNIWRANIIKSASLIQFGGVAAAVQNFLQPTGPGCCDHNKSERVANIVTSLPYMAIGVESMRRRKTAAGKIWAGSMVGVGAGSVAFHASSGKWRQLGRRLDYWAIALSSCMLTRAIYPEMPPVLTSLGVVATPFKPFLVSACNTLAMELKFLQRSNEEPSLRHPQRVHSAAALASMVLFTLEDHVPQIPFVHASWHGLSALGCSTINALFKDAEDTAAWGEEGRWKLQDHHQQQLRDVDWSCCYREEVSAAAGAGLLLEPLKL